MTEFEAWDSLYAFHGFTASDVPHYNGTHIQILRKR